MVMRPIWARKIAGSSPATLTCLVAQLVEQLFYTQEVIGSIPMQTILLIQYR